MTDFGKDTFCLDSIRTGRFATGAMLVGQRFYHRLITPRGMLRGGEEEANFGEDLYGLVGLPAGADTERQIRSKVDRAKSQEEAILSIETSIVTSTTDAGEVTHEVTIDTDTAEGPFRLVLAVGAVTVELVGLT